jgi:tetratricopeptide (TPR) repeat protein
VAKPHLLESLTRRRLSSAFVFIFFITRLTPAMAIDLAPLWNFSDPAQSEQRFRAALATASAGEALILQTQIARTHGLRKEFAVAQQILREVEPQLADADADADASAEARVRHALEYGRTLSSATHDEASQTADVKAQARAAYQRAFEQARVAKLDDLAIDALHMLAFVDTAPADQLKWGQEALAVALGSRQPSARGWEASLRNNIGYALHQLERYDEALEQFQRAVILRERGSNAESARVAHWMVAWTLRALKRNDEALLIQERLERECDAAAAPDPYVFEELEILYRERGDAARAEAAAARKKALEK